MFEEHNRQQLHDELGFAVEQYGHGEFDKRGEKIVTFVANPNGLVAEIVSFTNDALSTLGVTLNDDPVISVTEEAEETEGYEQDSWALKVKKLNHPVAVSPAVEMLVALIRFSKKLAAQDAQRAEEAAIDRDREELSGWLEDNHGADPGYTKDPDTSPDPA
jgi:hypothetical protein